MRVLDWLQTFFISFHILLFWILVFLVNILFFISKIIFFVSLFMVFLIAPLSSFLIYSNLIPFSSFLSSPVIYQTTYINSSIFITWCSDDDEQDETMDRSILKASSMKNIRAAEKKAAKETKNRSDLVQNNNNHWNIQWLHWLEVHTDWHTDWKRLNSITLLWVIVEFVQRGTVQLPSFAKSLSVTLTVVFPLSGWYITS